MLLAVLALGRWQEVSACTVPVFRYGLERWRADDYEIFIYHRGELAAKDKAVADWLTEQAGDEETPWNARVYVIDVDTEMERYERQVWEAQVKAKASLPWMVVRYPYPARVMADLWAGPVSMEVAKRLPMSPARGELAKRILQGHSAVWMLLQIGDAAKDEAAAACLRRELKAIQAELTLPPDDPNVESGVPTAPGDPIPVVFSVLEVSRKDPAEEMLVRMLLRLEPDLAELSEPMAFPIFGRGRVLFPLVGKGINAEMIGEASAFLAAPCSCVIKAQNPGVDLLMSVGWDRLIEQPVVSDAEFARIMGRAPAVPATTKPATTQGSVASAGEAGTTLESSPVFRSVAVTLGGILLVVAVLFLVLRSRSLHR